MSPSKRPDRPLSYFLVITGGELLEGVYPDAHTPFLTRTLRPLGAQCVGSMLVDDDRLDIQTALRLATNRAPLVIVTGGLGPTPNDITRETLADFTGIALREHPDLVRRMEERFKQAREQLRPNLLRQTQTPTQGSYLKNSNGTAAGLIFELSPTVIVALPGPPRELQPMVREELIPYLRERFGVHQFGSSKTLRFVGAGQSLIDQTIKDHVALDPDVTVTSLFEGSRVDFTFSLPGNTSAEQEKLRRLEAGIREHLEEYFYADDGSSLEEAVLKKIQGESDSFVIVEMATGGSVAAALSAAPGSEKTLKGAYIAATPERLGQLLPSFDALSGQPTSQWLSAAALTAQKTTGANAALVIGPVETDPAGAKLIRVGLQRPKDRWELQRLPLGGSGEIARPTVTTQILDICRRWLSQPAAAPHR